MADPTIWIPTNTLAMPDPVNWSHDLMRGMRYMFLPIPETRSGTNWDNLASPNFVANAARAVGNDVVAINLDFVGPDGVRSVRMDHVDNYFDLEDYDFPGDMSVSIWIYIIGLAKQWLINKNAPAAANFGMRIEAGLTVKWFQDAANYPSSGGISRDTWHHLVVTRDIVNNSIDLYIDKVGQQLNAYTGTPSTNTNSTVIGRDAQLAAGPANLDGFFGDTLVWDDRVLTQDEVDEIYDWRWMDRHPLLRHLDVPMRIPAAAAGGRIMSSLVRSGGLAGAGGIAGYGGGLAG